MSVEYRELPYNPGYRVGSDGSVWSRVGKRKKHMPKGCPLPLLSVWRELTPHVNSKNGRLQVKIYSASLQFKFRHVPQLVLEAFVGPRPEGMQCCHNDGNRKNNRLDNLRWDTTEANYKDAAKHGSMKGESNGNRKLSIEQVRAIRAALAAGGTHRGLGRQYGVTGTTIKSIATGKLWGHTV